jgi:hypothetical protein
MPTHTVRVNMLANIEAFLNMLANSAEIMLCVIGLIVVVGGMKLVAKNSRREIKAPVQGKFSLGVGLIWSGLLFPAFINWIVAAFNDYYLFN